MSSNSLNALMHKLYSMEKTLGPKGGKAGANGVGDSFGIIKQTIVDTIATIRRKMDEKENKITKFGGNNVETIRMGGEIRDLLKDLDKQLGQMNETLRKQKRDRKRYPLSEIELKEKQYNNFIAQMKDLKIKEKGGSVFQEPQLKTLMDIKSDLFERSGVEMKGPERDLNADEEAAIERFKETDRKQDELIDQINDGLETLAVKAKNIGDQIDTQTDVIENLNMEIEGTYTELESSNARLKKVLTEYRKPSKLCMDVCLLIILLGLIGVIIKCF